MADIVPRQVRSRMMAGIRGKNTKPELLVRKALTSLGLRYRLHRRDLPGVPDVVLPRLRAAIFAHGCFWHQHFGCRFAKLPGSNREFWLPKLERNAARDQAATEALVSAGWRVLTVWECATRRESIPDLARLLADWLEGGGTKDEIPGVPSDSKSDIQDDNANRQQE